jgi:hypothetical protein
VVAGRRYQDRDREQDAEQTARRRPGPVPIHGGHDALPDFVD